MRFSPTIVCVYEQCLCQQYLMHEMSVYQLNTTHVTRSLSVTSVLTLRLEIKRLPFQ